LRASVDLRNEKIGAKIREGRLDLVPYLAVVSEKESNAGTCGVRSRKEGEWGEIAVDVLIEKLNGEIRERSL
jgi:threonyl-tRNA synthetase